MPLTHLWLYLRLDLVVPNTSFLMLTIGMRSRIAFETISLSIRMVSTLTCLIISFFLLLFKLKRLTQKHKHVPLKWYIGGLCTLEEEHAFRNFWSSSLLLFLSWSMKLCTCSWLTWFFGIFPTIITKIHLSFNLITLATFLFIYY